MNRGFTRCVVPALASLAGAASGQTFDITADWAEGVNPNGAWSFREGANALPAVASWQSALGGWSAAQPGFARSENGSDRLPFWFKSNGTEQFDRDFQKGDVVVHTTDGSNGIGQGNANVAWTSAGAGLVSISGGVWMGRDIGRSNDWFLFLNDTLLTSGSIASGDVYSRANPYDFADGSGDSGAVTDVVVLAGDVLRLEFARTSAAGDFVGVDMIVNFTAVPAPGAAVFAGAGVLGLGRRRRL
jgi:hypothetical protein